MSPLSSTMMMSFLGTQEFLLDFLRHAGLCLPSTTDVHQGDHTTWTSPDGLSNHRIDYVAIPTLQLGRCTHSQVLHTMDTGNNHADHTACALQMQWTDRFSVKVDMNARCIHDRDKIASSWQQLGAAQVHIGNWDCDIETQVVSLNSNIHAALKATCPKIRGQPKKPYITPETWKIRTEKLALHKRIRQSRKQQGRDFIAVFFRSWAGHIDMEELECNSGASNCGLVQTNCPHKPILGLCKTTSPTPQER